MKNISLILAAACLMASCGPTYIVQDAPPPEPAPVATVSYQSFYDDLAPYGSWINYPGYGYVWMPAAGPDFIPYNTNGNWIYTEAGWTWASDYPWGWAPFHYGRWFYESGYGWMWVPGNEWAPAWVSWRGGNDYYGWAPLGPNVSVDIALHSYNPPANYWSFVPRRYMGASGWHGYAVNQSRNITIINNTTIINNYSGTNRTRYAYAPGPDPVEVRRVSGSNIQPVRIREVNTPGSRVSNNQFDIYRPRVDAAPSNRADVSARPAPARVQNLRDVRPQVRDNNNNARPAQAPAYNNEPRPAEPAGTRPQNPPAYNGNPRPATQPQNNPSVNPRPAGNPATGPAPAARPEGNSGSRPAEPANPGNRRPENDDHDRRSPSPAPNNNPRPAAPAPQPQNPANNNRPAARPAGNPAPAVNPATTGRPADSRYNQQRGNARPAQQQAASRPAPANQRQPQAQPAPASRNPRPQSAQPLRRAQAPQPQQKDAEKPKTRSAN
jgi:hypothetical protein